MAWLPATPTAQALALRQDAESGRIASLAAVVSDATLSALAGSGFGSGASHRSACGADVRVLTAAEHHRLTTFRLAIGGSSPTGASFDAIADSSTFSAALAGMHSRLGQLVSGVCRSSEETKPVHLQPLTPHQGSRWVC